MSRSRRKTLKTGIASADSEKKDKRFANRTLRKRNRAEVKRGEEEVFTTVRENSNIYSFAKDGKRYWRERSRWLRECLEHPEGGCTCWEDLLERLRRK